MAHGKMFDGSAPYRPRELRFRIALPRPIIDADADIHVRKQPNKPVALTAVL
jgi:hypothetical protein